MEKDDSEGKEQSTSDITPPLPKTPAKVDTSFVPIFTELDHHAMNVTDISADNLNQSAIEKLCDDL